MKRIGSAATAGLALVFLTVPLVCLAGSGAHWKITVKNPTTHTVAPIAYYMSGNLKAELVGDTRVDIPPGGQYTFTVPGSWCPAGVTGSIYWERQGWFYLQDTNCFGDQTLDGLPGTTCCSDLTFEVCRKQGPSDDSTISNNDYGYCKK